MQNNSGQNGQMEQAGTPSGVPVQPSFGVQPGISYNPSGQGHQAPGAPPAQGQMPAGQQGMAQSVQTYAPADYASPNKSVMETVIIIVLGLVSATFIGLFVWMYVQWDDAKTDVDGQIATAVADAVAENTEDLQAQYAEKEKSPYETFTGPTEYGSFSFEYPKTWSVYVEEDNDDGGSYVAYFHPSQVNPVSTSQIFALRFSIKADNFDTVASKYDSNLKKGDLTLSTVQINGTSANYYIGTLPDKHVGRVLIIKVRDKTVTLQTDAEIYADDFETLLGTITFSQ